MRKNKIRKRRLKGVHKKVAQLTLAVVLCFGKIAFSAGEEETDVFVCGSWPDSYSVEIAEDALSPCQDAEEAPPPGMVYWRKRLFPCMI